MALPAYMPRQSPVEMAASSKRARRMLLASIAAVAVVTILALASGNRGADRAPSGSIRNNAASKVAVPTIRLRSGLEMPALGYGTCCRESARGEAIYRSTLAYLREGGRLVDTAMAYRNHAEVGRAVKDSGVPRSEVWITSKVAPGRVRDYDACLEAVDGILAELGTDYVDLLLIHTPKLGKGPTVELWRGLIEAKRLGKARSIGVSNFNKGEMLDLEEATSVLPEANQIQQHPWSTPSWKDLARWQRENGIVTIAYTSLGGSRFHGPHGGGEWPSAVTDIARAHGATAAQVLLKWALKKNIAVIPGSGSVKHIRENLRLPDFVLSDEESAAVEGAEVPDGWWDARRGYQKYTDEEAGLPWAKRKNG